MIFFKFSNCSFMFSFQFVSVSNLQTTLSISGLTYCAVCLFAILVRYNLLTHLYEKITITIGEDVYGFFYLRV